MGFVSRVVVLVLALVIAAGSVAEAQSERRDPRTFYLGIAGGLGLVPEISEFTGNDTVGITAAVGGELGIQRRAGNMVFAVEADALPLGGIYRGRGSFLIGHHFTSKYSVPCAASPGMSCVKTYNYRDVNNVIGLKLGGDVGTTPDGEIASLEVGFGWRGQISLDMTFGFDPVNAGIGGQMDFAWQFGPVYLGFEMRGMTGEDQPLPLLMLFNLGYASGLSW